MTLFSKENTAADMYGLLLSIPAENPVYALAFKDWQCKKRFSFYEDFLPFLESIRVLSLLPIEDRAPLKKVFLDGLKQELNFRVYEPLIEWFMTEYQPILEPELANYCLINAITQVLGQDADDGEIFYLDTYLFLHAKMPAELFEGCLRFAAGGNVPLTKQLTKSFTLYRALVDKFGCNDDTIFSYCMQNPESELINEMLNTDTFVYSDYKSAMEFADQHHLPALSSLLKPVSPDLKKSGFVSEADLCAALADFCYKQNICPISLTNTVIEQAMFIQLHDDVAAALVDFSDAFDTDEMALVPGALPSQALAVAASLLLNDDMLDSEALFINAFFDAQVSGGIAHAKKLISNHTPFDACTKWEEDNEALHITFNMAELAMAVFWSISLYPDVDLNKYQTLHDLVHACIKNKMLNTRDIRDVSLLSTVLNRTLLNSRIYGILETLDISDQLIADEAA